MSSQIVIGISDQNIALTPDSLVTYALGSCVGICLHDPLVGLGGLSHILLPQAPAGTDQTEIYKFADTAIEELVRNMEKKGGARFRFTAKIAGGANMFATKGISIGDRNVEAVKSELSRLNIRLIAEATGGTCGRTIVFEPGTGLLTIRSIGRGTSTI